MGLFHKIRNAVSPTLPADPDSVEWDAEDAAGDESAYDGLAAESISYDPADFDTPTDDDVEVIKV